MHISSLSLVQFRNLNRFSMSFAPGINIIYGPNGAGKTSILEAISFSSLTKSFKTHRDNFCIQKGEDYFQIRVKWLNVAEEEVQVNFLKQEGKRILLEKVTLEKFSDLIGRYPVVIQSPEDISITAGGSKERRLFFNRLQAQTHRSFISEFQRYSLILRQRNAHLKLLKSSKHRRYDLNLEALDSQLIPVAWRILSARKELVRGFSQRFTEIFDTIIGKRNIEITLSPSIDAEDEISFGEIYSRRSREGVESEIIMSRSLYGPNYDRIHFTLDGQPLESYASQGEHKLWMTLMKLTEGEIIHRALDIYPVFLLDDLFAELDVINSHKIVQAITGQSQVIVTSTDLSDLRNHGIDLEQSTVNVFNLAKNS